MAPGGGEDLQISLGIADIFMVSSLGEVSVSGVSLVDQINVLLTQIFAALGAGGAVVCSQYIGAKGCSNFQKIARQLLKTMFVVSMALAALVLLVLLYRGINTNERSYVSIKGIFKTRFD